MAESILDFLRFVDRLISPGAYVPEQAGLAVQEPGRVHEVTHAELACPQVLAQIVVAQLRALARVLVAGVGHGVGVDRATGAVPPMVVGQTSIDDSDLEASEEAEVEIPVSHHREALVEQADLLVHGAPINERNRRERVIGTGGEEFDVLQRQVILAAKFIHAALGIKFFEHPGGLGDDTLHGTGRPCFIEKLDAGAQKIAFPRVVVIMDGDKFARRDG